MQVTDHRTRKDWAHAMKTLADEICPQAEKIVVVMDNLNTHSPISFHETFAPEEARHLANRFEFHYTPKYSSWLNMAEIELGILVRQCLYRRISEKSILEREVLAWQNSRNAKAVKVNWRFTTADARLKLRSLYPKISE